MTNALDLLAAKRNTFAAQEEEKRVAEQLKREEKIRFFAPIRAVIDELMDVEPPIAFYGEDYCYHQKPLQRSQFSATTRFRQFQPSFNEAGCSFYPAYGYSYYINVDSSAGLKFVIEHVEGNGTTRKRKEFTDPQDAISDLLDVIAELAVADVPRADLKP